MRTATLLEEVAMAGAGRMRLHVGILDSDSDPAYGMVLKQYLMSAGCEVKRSEAKLWFSIDNATGGSEAMEQGAVLLIDEQMDGAETLINKATKVGRSVIVSKNPALKATTFGWEMERLWWWNVRWTLTSSPNLDSSPALGEFKPQTSSNSLKFTHKINSLDARVLGFAAIFFPFSKIHQ
ncbi:MAG: hypothetical protein GY822_14230 [Deltaproteobacteria bacterium]|nr:hypothetical protein [Deltaproteobacteria bacterium]